MKRNDIQQRWLAVASGGHDVALGAGSRGVADKRDE